MLCYFTEYAICISIVMQLVFHKKSRCTKTTELGVQPNFSPCTLFKIPVTLQQYYQTLTVIITGDRKYIMVITWNAVYFTVKVIGNIAAELGRLLAVLYYGN